jgi:hypothetical protein
MQECLDQLSHTIQHGQSIIRYIRQLSDVEPLFTCQVCGQRGADVRPNFSWEEAARRTTISGRHTSGPGQKAISGAAA